MWLDQPLREYFEVFWLVPPTSSRQGRWNDGRLLTSEPIYVTKLKAIEARLIEADITKYDVVANLRLLREVLGRWQIDAVYAHFSPLRYHLELAAKLSGVQVIRAEHGFTFHRERKYKVPKWLFYKWTTDYYITVSRSVLDHLRNVRLCSYNASVVYDGFDIERYPAPRKQESRRIIAREIPFPAEASILTCIGRIDRGKQQHLLIEMMRHLDANVHLLLVGAREDSRYEDELRTLIARYGLGRRVHFTGYRRDVPRILDATDISFLPSSNEGLGNAIVESFIMRVPVIASSIPPIREIIDDGVSGYCVPGSDVSGYVRRTRELLDDSGKREVFAQKGREKVERVFSRESFVRGSTQALARALDHRRFTSESS